MCDCVVDLGQYLIVDTIGYVVMPVLLTHNLMLEIKYCNMLYHSNSIEDIQTIT